MQTNAPHAKGGGNTDFGAHELLKAALTSCLNLAGAHEMSAMRSTATDGQLTPRHDALLPAHPVPSAASASDSLR